MDNSKGTTSTFLYFSVCAVNLAAFSVGTSIAWSSSALPKLNGKVDPENNPLRPHTIDTSEESLIASLLAIGGIVSPFIAATLADRLGRKKALMLCVLPIYLSYVIIYFADSVWMFYVARFLQGFTCGSCFVILPNYVAEFAENHNRGALSCLLGVNITLGILVFFAIGPFMTLQTLSLYGLLAPSLFYILVGLYVPESSVYLLVKQDEDAAEKALKKLRKAASNDIKKEILELNSTLGDEPIGLMDMFKNKTVVKALAIVSGLMIFQQVCGINAVLFYLLPIFEATGSNLSPEASTIFIGAVQFISSSSAPLIVDRLGRKILLFASAVGNFVSLTGLGMYFYVKDSEMSGFMKMSPIVCLVIYIITYNVGYGPMPWTILGEVFPNEVKAIASTLSVMTSFTFAFIISFFFPHMLEYLGIAMCFWMFGVCCLLSIVFIHIYVPETKGKSVKEIQQLLQSN